MLARNAYRIATRAPAFRAAAFSSRASANAGSAWATKARMAAVIGGLGFAAAAGSSVAFAGQEEARIRGVLHA